MCEPLFRWGVQRRGGYKCMCKPGYRYPYWQQGPFMGIDIEQATEDEYRNGFDCIRVQWRQIWPYRTEWSNDTAAASADSLAPAESAASTTNQLARNSGAPPLSLLEHKARRSRRDDPTAAARSAPKRQRARRDTPPQPQVNSGAHNTVSEQEKEQVSSRAPLSNATSKANNSLLSLLIHLPTT